MFIIEAFNQAWENERKKVATHLSDVLKNEIKSLRASILVESNKEHASELRRMLSQLILRKALVDYESEEIVKRRMDMRASYLAVVTSAAALIISVGVAIYAGANKLS